jgi:putative FmdB family regulatory protein
MPIYTYHCSSCDHEFDELLSVTEGDEPQKCPKCKGESRKVISGCNFNLPGDGWVSKNGRIAAQMREKNKRLAGKEDEMKRGGRVPSLVPNVGGELTDSWKDAAKLAKDKGKDSSGYEKKAREKVSR